MLAALHQLVGLLRDNGVVVATADVIDAARALAGLGLDDRATVRAALGATLVHDLAGRARFDELFDLYFRSGALLATDDLAARLVAAGLGPELAARLAALVAAEAATMTPLGRAVLGLAPLDLAGLVAGRGLTGELDHMTSPLQVGFLSYRLAEALGLGQTEHALGAQLARLARAAGAEGAELDAVGGVVREAAARVQGALRRLVDDAFRRQHLDFAAEIAVRSLDARPLSQLGAREVGELRAEVARLARLLRARLKVAPSRRRRGRLDVSRTLRRALATEGKPFVLHRRLARRRKPRLVVLCDISDSVRNVSRFMLELTYALHELWDHVYSFAFVAELGELTPLFRDHELGRAVELAYGGAVVNVFANSNYGAALERFAARHLSKVNRRTTVLVIGDGRSNYHAPRAEILGAIRARARQLIWITPEPTSAWGFGDSAMREYAPHCDRVAVAHNLVSLRRVIDDLVG